MNDNLSQIERNNHHLKKLILEKFNDVPNFSDSSELWKAAFEENLRQNFFHNNNSIAPFNSFSKLSYNNLKLKFEPLTNVIKPLDNLNENKIIDSVLSTTKSILVPINNNNKFNVKEKNLTNTNSIEKFTTKNSEFGTVVSKVWENVKKMIGFSPECKNGGQKNLRGDCYCPDFYKGEYCENIICLNNGTKYSALSHIDSTIMIDYCRCPYSEFITGKHCEIVSCHNGGRYLGNGSCACVDGWYTGQFCQYYTSSWLLAIGLPLLCVAMLIMCCVICRLDLCPRHRRSVQRDRRSRRYYFPQSRRHLNFQQHQQEHLNPSTTQYQFQQQNFFQQQQQQNSPFMHSAFEWRNFVNNTQSLANINQEAVSREHLLPSHLQNNLINRNILREMQGFNGFYENLAHQQQQIVQLEQIPDYNLHLPLPGANNSNNLVQQQLHFKIEPPPPYDQAILRCPTINLNFSPPDYTFINSNNLNETLTENGVVQR